MFRKVAGEDHLEEHFSNMFWNWKLGKE
jgi:hypothetical protein